jgi:DNA-binding PadR family transcriptional regulator
MSVRHALLALLSEGPKYGLQLRQEFEAGTGEVWPLNVGQVYMTLQRLERDGLVVSDDAGEGAQKAYRLTDVGHDELVRWLGPPPRTGPPPRDELVIKVLVALHVPGVDVLDLVQAHRHQVVTAMQGYTALKADAADGDIGLLLVVDAELYRLDAVARWLDTAEARLRGLLPTGAGAGAGAGEGDVGHGSGAAPAAGVRPARAAAPGGGR